MKNLGLLLALIVLATGILPMQVAQPARTRGEKERVALTVSEAPPLFDCSAISSKECELAAEQETTIERQLFSYQITVSGRETRGLSAALAAGTRVRIKYDASDSLTFFCQDSSEYLMSAFHGWSLIWYHWDDETAHMDKTYTVPTADTWYFTLANYGYSDVDVFNVTLGQLDTYKVRLTSDKAYYHKGEHVALVAKATKNDEPISGLNLNIRVLSPSGNVVFDQTNGIDMYGQVAVHFALPSEEGTYNSTAQISVEGRVIECCANFAIDETPPIINIVLPKNGSWVSSSVSLVFNTSEPFSWVAYSLNESANVTIAGNAMLSGLLGGTYNMILYSTDMAGNTGHSSDVFFYVDTTPPSTNDDYDGLWHTSNYTMALTAVDESSSVGETYYSINHGSVQNVSVGGQPCFNIPQQNSTITIDGDMSDWSTLSLGPIGTDPANNVGHHDISSDLLEAWAYADTENLYLAMKVNGGGSYNYDNVNYQVYLYTSNETYKAKYFGDWYDHEGYGDLFYWDQQWNEGGGIWQTRVYLEAQAGPGGYIEWKVPLCDDYGRPTIESSFNSGIQFSPIPFRFVTSDGYSDEEINGVSGIISIPDPSNIEGYAIEGAHNRLEYWSVDSAGNQENHHVLADIKLDKTAPTGSILINNGAAYSNSTSITLSLTANDSVSVVAEMRFSNDNISWTSWEMYDASRAWSLTLSDGAKMVCCQFADSAGLTSSVYTDGVVLDTTSPIIEAPTRIPEGDLQSDRSVTICVNASDLLSGVKSVWLAYNASEDSWPQFPMTLNLTTGLYEYTIPGQKVDTLLKYKITAYDRAENGATNDNAGQNYQYRIVSEFPWFTVLLSVAAATVTMAMLLAVMAYRRRKVRCEAKISEGP